MCIPTFQRAQSQPDIVCDLHPACAGTIPTPQLFQRSFSFTEAPRSVTADSQQDVAPFVVYPATMVPFPVTKITPLAPLSANTVPSPFHDQEQQRLSWEYLKGASTQRGSEGSDKLIENSLRDGHCASKHTSGFDATPYAAKLKHTELALKQSQSRVTELKARCAELEQSSCVTKSRAAAVSADTVIQDCPWEYLKTQLDPSEWDYLAQQVAKEWSIHLSQVEGQHEQVIQQLAVGHQEEMQQLRAVFDEQLQEVHACFGEQFMVEWDAQVLAIENQHDTKVQQIYREHVNQMRQMQDDWSSQVQELQDEKDAATSNTRLEFSEFVLSLIPELEPVSPKGSTFNI